MLDFLTRLTPNQNEWRKPSGADGKCGLKKKSPYEGKTHFGWEEWLLRDFHEGLFQLDGYCYGFIQAFHGKNKIKTKIDNIYLYTRICIGTKSKTYLVGKISNVQIINGQLLSKAEDQKLKEFIKQIHIDLVSPDFIDYSTDLNQMISEKSLYNVRFKAEDVHLLKNILDARHQIELPHGWYRFNLYDLNKKTNLHSQLNQILK
jgi:hypothetical protein